jgi:hypothetical protein
VAATTRPVTTTATVLGNRPLDATATATMTKMTKKEDAKDNPDAAIHQTTETTTRSPGMIDEMTTTTTQIMKQ